MSNTIEKSFEERKIIKLMKSVHKQKLSGAVYTTYESTQQFPLVVYTKKSPNVEGYKSTHSFLVFKNDVDNTLSLLKDKGYVIGKVYFNGKTYRHE